MTEIGLGSQWVSPPKAAKELAKLGRPISYQLLFYHAKMGRGPEMKQEGKRYYFLLDSVREWFKPIVNLPRSGRPRTRNAYIKNKDVR